MKKAYELLSIRQVDVKLKQWSHLKTFKPTKGWIVYVREALSLPAAHLAKLMGIAQSSVFSMEKREQSQTITLETLEKVAQVMGCELVYAFVPKTTLEDFVEQQYQVLIEKTLNDTNLTMALENQGLSEQDVAQQKKLMIDELKGYPLKYLWRHL